MAITYSDPDVDAAATTIQIAALSPTDNAVIIGNGTAWTAESGSTLRTSLGLAIGTDVMAYDADLADWAGVNPSSYLTTAAAALAYQPLVAGLTSWGGVTRAAGFDTFAATPSSANLRALLTDESGSGALLFAGGALGTPASGTLTSCTGLPVSTGISGLGTGIATFLATPSSVNLKAAVTDETGSGALVFANTPTLVTPNIGAATGTTISLSGAYTSTGAGFVSATGYGLTPANYVANARNVIFNFATASAYGISYFQGTAGKGGVDSIGMHFGTATDAGSQFAFSSAGHLDIRSTVQSSLRLIRNDGAEAYVFGRSQNNDDGHNFFIYDSIAAGFCMVFSSGRALRLHAYGAGTLVTDASGNVTASSDERLKTDFAPFTRGLSDLLAMDTPVSFRWNEDSGMDTNDRYTGFTAQGIQKGIPEAVSEGPNGMLNVQDRPIVAAMWNAIKELSSRLDALEAAQ